MPTFDLEKKSYYAKYNTLTDSFRKKLGTAYKNISTVLSPHFDNAEDLKIATEIVVYRAYGLIEKERLQRIPLRTLGHTQNQLNLRVTLKMRRIKSHA